ncbi:hypothetical protein [Planctomicrobium piriforme]|uniref:Uncharacterized protein n=1 Tax=Planctomicrobium piriforme TaxID=1576369 RepID=A0A1I3DI57_9PLAN|nr:hypothetical protein [Planctomicrobium piriforme]SFH86452.1 hypothetical protein SAMN05421753_103255 [Planctomicrobium piriforme]
MARVARSDALIQMVAIELLSELAAAESQIRHAHLQQQLRTAACDLLDGALQRHVPPSYPRMSSGDEPISRAG